MTEVTRIMIQLQRPRGSDPGKVAEGHFIVDDGKVLLSDKYGSPVDRYRLCRKIEPGSDPRIIACNLLRSRYSGVSHEFNRPLQYPKVRF